MSREGGLDKGCSFWSIRKLVVMAGGCQVTRGKELRSIGAVLVFHTRVGTGSSRVALEQAKSFCDRERSHSEATVVAEGLCCGHRARCGWILLEAWSFILILGLLVGAAGSDGSY